MIGLADNLAKFEWENDIPFKESTVKKTISAMIGEEKPSVLGLLNYNTKKVKWTGQTHQICNNCIK